MITKLTNKITSLVSARGVLLVSLRCYFFSNDAIKGNYKEMKKHGIIPEVSATASFRRGEMIDFQYCQLKVKEE